MSSIDEQSTIGFGIDNVMNDVRLPKYLDNGGAAPVQGEFVKLEGSPFYRIARYDLMPPFLMTIVSPNDQWMYVSSRGGLTAGRVSAENCLFPYESVDKLHHCHSHTGPLTLIKLTDSSDKRQLWQPFSYHLFENGSCVRNIYKHVVGNQVVFEEDNQQLGLTFRYRWQNSNQFGFVRTVTLENTGTAPCEIDLLDGLQNLQPFGIKLATYQQASCLTDAYKQSLYDPSTKIGVFSLTSQILDHPAAAEVLKATTVACVGLDDYAVLLSSDQLREFCFGERTSIQSEQLSTGKRGHYYACTNFSLAPGESKSWHLIADVARDHCQIARLRTLLADTNTVEFALQESLERAHHSLVRNVACSDGLQITGSQFDSTHHFANVLFNNMRGGVLAANYQLETDDFRSFVEARNKETYRNVRSYLTELPEVIDYGRLIGQIAEKNNRDLLRLGFEYLPFTFSRRHGDPSRPWNHFNIHIHNADGSRDYHYEGNWRDIFQNWEALGQSFPMFLPSMIAKFVNASTVDGYNPYRISRDGFDWETPAPNDSWGNFGYWGDHQIVYLLKLIESTRQHFPGLLEEQLEDEGFVYADVPYRIEAYDKLVKNSRETIQYDVARAAEIEMRVKIMGEDGKLVRSLEGDIRYVSLIEKLLVPALAKLSNLVLGGGIWMNTQRPEWNDANNALAGSGLSVVTTCYLCRYLDVVIELLERVKNSRITISREVAEWLRLLSTVFVQNRHLLEQPSVSDSDRRHLLDELGQVFSDYRLKVYEQGLSGKDNIDLQQIMTLLHDARDYLDNTIHSNQRSDGLYHAYNLLQLGDTQPTAGISHLYEMLEGQVAILSSGRVGPSETVQIVNKMFDGPLYRPDQQSFLLYPERELPRFLDRNVLPGPRVRSIELLSQLIDSEESSLIVRSDRGEYHFVSEIVDVRCVQERLKELSRDPRWSLLVEQDSAAILELFEEVFQHSKYTGRSGTMYGYEGLGSVYWHMVAKLLLAVQEVFFKAVEEEDSPKMIQSLANAYYRVRSGLSSSKTPLEYGAFPADPYSHTPQHAGAQQPGMTGQVKEEILTRRGELGVLIRGGRIHFNPCLLRPSEFVSHATEFTFYDLEGKAQTLAIEPRELAFTIYQTPVIYRLAEAGSPMRVEVFTASVSSDFGDCLNEKTSRMIFNRTGEITRIEVEVPPTILFSSKSDCKS